MSTGSRAVKLPTGDTIPYTVNERNVKNPRLTLNPDGTVTAIVPPETAGHTLITDEQEWIASKYEHQQTQLKAIIDIYGRVTKGFTLWGQPYDICKKTGAYNIKLKKKTLILTIPADHSAKDHLKKKLRQALRVGITSIADDFCQKIDQYYNKITIRSQRTKWASCSSNLALNFNLRCAFLPITHLQYLVAHEVSHLIEPNHNKQFWRMVESLCPDYQKQKAELEGLWYAIHHNLQWQKLLDTSHSADSVTRTYL